MLLKTKEARNFRRPGTQNLYEKKQLTRKCQNVIENQGDGMALESQNCEKTPQIPTKPSSQ
jgi:hypothetical protein